ncbi:MAG: DUF11 domain-containing protein, partial [Candidatus Yanofskybacteria bacterium]|nr:DUF11 domain-containing protein [Candidatus Yanofskybacteria bacterium]
ASFAPGSHHQVTVTYNANRYSCGRVQVDGCFKNEATGECRDSGGGLALGAVIDYGTNCVAPTASPAPTRSTPPSPTPTPTPTITTTPTTSATPTPTPTGSTLPPVVCSPTTQPVTAGHAINLTASGGTGTYAWYTIGGLSTSASGATYAVTFATIGTKVVVVASGGNMASCTVFVYPPPTPTPSLTPTPTASITPTPTSSATPTSTPVAPALTLQKLVRNVTQGSGEADSVNANPSDTVEFSLRVSSVGIGSVLSAVVRDSLPAGLTYIPGSTTVDGAPAADGIVASGLNLGDLASGRTVTVRFRASVAAAGFFSQGSTVMTNTGYARGSNAAEVNDVAFVNVVNAPQNLSMSLTKMGRNTSRGQTGEASPVYAAPAETVEFILRVRNTSNAVLTNVLLRDIVPQGMTALAGSVRVNGSPAPDSLTSGGLSLGTLAVGQEITVLLSARVAVASQLPAGTTTVLNTAQASADSIGTLTAQLPVIITTPTTPVTQVPTGPGESTLLALIVSAIITLLYVGYTSTDAYRRHEAGALAKGAHDDKDLFDFRR